MQKVPVIVGPTAVGKTALTLKLSAFLPIEIVSADSRQIYRYLNIGTAKASENVLRKMPHHFIDILKPDETYSAGLYSKAARAKISDIWERRKIPVVCGGSGLYIRALIDGLSVVDAKDDSLRVELAKRAESEGLPQLYEELKTVDPQYAQKISKNDNQRILRALEVFLVTQKTATWWAQQKPEPASFTAVFYGLNMERSHLYERINDRVDEMFSQGLLEEVEALSRMGYNGSINALNTVGYKELFEYLQHKISLDRAKELIKRNSRRYAKRQFTWFRKDERIVWYRIASEADLDKLAKKIKKDLGDR